MSSASDRRVSAATKDPQQQEGRDGHCSPIAMTDHSAGTSSYEPRRWQHEQRNASMASAAQSGEQGECKRRDQIFSKL